MIQKISLILILLTTLSARADSFALKVETLPSPNPSGYTSYSPEKQKDLVAYIKNCEVKKKDLKDTKDSLDACRVKIGKDLQYWQKPSGAITLGVLILLLGGVAGSQL